MADKMDDSDAFEKMLVLGLGLLAASVARKAASPTFDHTLSPGRRLLWMDGALLRRTVPITYQNQSVGRVIVDVRLPEFESVLIDAALMGATAETHICVPESSGWIACLPSRFNHEPIRLGRVAPGEPGRAITQAVDGNFGTMVGLNLRRIKVHSAYGGIPSYSLGLVSQVTLAELYNPVRGTGFWFSLFAAAVVIAMALGWRVPIRSAS